MVELDPGLGPGDLRSAGTPARPDRDHPWGGPGGGLRSRPTAGRTRPAAGQTGARNIEIKARVADLDRFRETVEAISDSKLEVLNQEDLFFAAPDGRLKLRIFGEDAAS